MISESLLPEFDREFGNLRKVLQRIPADKFDWRPHPRANTMGWLASHLAELPTWGVMTLKGDSFDVDANGGYKMWMATTNDELVAKLDQNVAATREAIANASDEHWMQIWRLQKGGQEIFAMPRVAVIRGMIINHMIHHRAQLTVYMRMNDIPVPGLYGPSADEPM